MELRDRCHKTYDPDSTSVDRLDMVRSLRLVLVILLCRAFGVILRF